MLPPDLPRPEPGFDFADQIAGRSAERQMRHAERLIYAAAGLVLVILLALAVMVGGRP